MTPLRRFAGGGSTGNAQLTAAVATILLVLLAIEGATLLRLQSLLTVHAFVGMLLVPIVGLKLASTGWRALRYYAHAPEYVDPGPPHIALRVLVAPLLGVSTVALFATGVALLVLEETNGPIVGLHKASFIVWVGALGLHVLAHALSLPRLLRRRPPGLALRVVVIAATFACGVAAAVGTLPAADRLQDHASAHFGLDRR